MNETPNFSKNISIKPEGQPNTVQINKRPFNERPQDITTTPPDMQSRLVHKAKKGPNRNPRSSL